MKDVLDMRLSVDLNRDEDVELLLSLLIDLYLNYPNASTKERDFIVGVRE